MHKLSYHASFLRYLLRQKLKVPSPPNPAPDVDEEKRLQHCLKAFSQQEIGAERSITIDELPVFRKTFYSYDLIRSYGYSKTKPRFHYEFGDVRETPEIPTFVKSRPISSTNQNACVLPLEMARHFVFFNDTIPFKKKQNSIFWRGAAYQPWRRAFLASAHDLPFCDVGDTARPDSATRFVKPYADPASHFGHKFLFSIEGNDVASNLKWAMGSNSVVMMTRPKFETWFCESRLIPDVHYIEIKDDISNLEEKFDEFAADEERCLDIIENARSYLRPFKDLERQYQLGGLLIDRYAERTFQRL